MQHFGINKTGAKTSHHIKLEEVLLRFKEATAAGVNIDGDVLREKAVDVALLLSMDDLQSS